MPARRLLASWLHSFSDSQRFTSPVTLLNPFKTKISGNSMVNNRMDHHFCCYTRVGDVVVEPFARYFQKFRLFCYYFYANDSSSVELRTLTEHDSSLENPVFDFQPFFPVSVSFNCIIALCI